MSTINEEEYKRRINEFLEVHKDAYTDKERDFIRKNAEWTVHSSNAFYVSSILRQVLAETNLLEEHKNMYKGFLKILEEQFDINRNIVEVAGGIFPSLAKMIALKQETGTITVYDPRIVVPDHCPKNLIVTRKSFTTKTKIPEDTQMLIAFMPCDATMDIIESACKNNMDFMISLCEGGERKGYGYLETDDEWIGMAKYIAERGMEGTDMGTLETASLEEYGNPYPIIYNKRKKS